jgi:hypothetical protein
MRETVVSPSEVAWVTALMSPARWAPPVRPAWAQSCGCKSRHELVTVSEVKRNCARVTERGKEA